MDAPKYAYEDLAPGLTLPLGPRAVSKEEILDFAREYDPQPFHLDEAAGKASPLGGLAASGWHTLSLLMRMMCDSYLNDSTSQGAPGVEFNRWKKPVLAGDVLSGFTTVIERRTLRSRPGIGLVTLQHELVNQRGEIVCELRHGAFFALRRPPESEAA